MSIDVIYQYDSIQEILKAILEQKLKVNPRLSIRSWAKRLDLKGHSYLHQIITGRRRANEEIIVKISKELNLSKVQSKYIELIFLSEMSPTYKKRCEYLRTAKNTIPDHLKSQFNISEDLFATVANWHHWAIVEMTHLKNFSMDPKDIYALLKEKVPQKEIKQSIERLLNLNILEIVDNKLIKKNKKTNVIDQQIPSLAIQEYHCQMISLATKSTRDPIGTRYLKASTLTIRNEHKEEIIDLINNFHQQVLNYAVTDQNGDQTFQLNSQFFPLSEA